MNKNLDFDLRSGFIFVNLQRLYLRYHEGILNSVIEGDKFWDIQAPLWKSLEKALCASGLN